MVSCTGRLNVRVSEGWSAGEQGMVRAGEPRGSARGGPPAIAYYGMCTVYREHSSNSFL